MTVVSPLAPLLTRPYGIGVHWTTWTQPAAGRPLSFPDAVDAFDVPAFVKRLREMGAGHLLFTSNHQLHWLPCPNAIVDGILPGRTCRRDLIGDLIEELSAYDMPLILYYHHGCDGPNQDPEWYRAVGAGREDRSTFYQNIMRITASMGERYGKGIAAWWFDAGWSLAAMGNVPWKQLALGAKAGYSERLVCFNPGIYSRETLSDVQDYWPGEAEGVAGRPDAATAPGGLPWYTFTTFHTLAEGGWGMDAATLALPRLPPPVSSVVNYVRSFQEREGAVTLNLSVFQNGTFWPPEVKVMRDVRQAFGV